MRELTLEGNSEGFNAQCQKAAKMLFNWREYARTQSVNWEPEISFSSSTSGTNPRHYFSIDTLQTLCEASLEFDTLPNYTAVTPEKRSEINAYLAQRLGKPKAEIGPDDWDRVNSWKVPAMIHRGIDAGLRNKESWQSEIRCSMSRTI